MPDVLSDAEARAIVGRVRNPVPRAALLSMYARGLRISEAARVEVTAIDGVQGSIRVIGKGNKERLVPLPKPVLVELRRLWSTHGDPHWLSVPTGAAMGRSPAGLFSGALPHDALLERLWQVFHAVVREAGIKRGVRPHSLRHSYATRLR